MPQNEFQIEITSPDGPKRLLAEPCALFCLWFKWSGDAVVSRKMIMEWHNQWHAHFKSQTVPLYLLDGDALPELWDWIGSTIQETGGYGSLSLFKNGKLVHRCPAIKKAGLDHISTLCVEHFGTIVN